MADTTTATIYDSNWFTDSDQSGPKHGLDPRPGAAVAAGYDMVEKFRKGTAKTFSRLDRDEVANDLVFQLRFPDAFRQRQSPFCGVASFVRIWAYDQPVAYVKLAIDLFEKGQGRLEAAGKHTGELITPSSELRASPPLHGMPQLDWMVMASVREALNHDFNHAHYKNVFAMTGGTSAPRIEMEFRAGGYTKVVRNETGGSVYQRMIEASNLYDQNWHVILSIEPWLLKGTEQEATIAQTVKGTHALGLDSEIVISNFRDQLMVQPFQVWSWDQVYAIPGWKKEIPIDAFKGCFWYVAGKF